MERRRFGLNGSWAGFWPPTGPFSLLANDLQEAKGNAAVQGVLQYSSGQEIGTSG